MKTFGHLFCVGMVFALVTPGCSKGPSGPAPLANNLSLTYEVETTGMGTTFKSTTRYRFTRENDNRFRYTLTTADQFGTRELENDFVDAYFKQQGVMTVQVEVDNIWMDVRTLASGKAGSRNVVTTTWNGKSVYAVENVVGKSYYEKASGILAGAEANADGLGKSLVMTKKETF